MADEPFADWGAASLAQATAPVVTGRTTRQTDDQLRYERFLVGIDERSKTRLSRRTQGQLSRLYSLHIRMRLRPFLLPCNDILLSCLIVQAVQQWILQRWQLIRNVN